jgi:hypothetical protein
MARVFALALGGTTGAAALMASPRSVASAEPGRRLTAQELLDKHERDKAQIHEDTEAERRRLGAAIADAERRKRAEDPSGQNKRAQGERWRQAEKERQDAVTKLNGLDAERNRRLSESTAAHQTAISLAKTEADGAQKAADSKAFGEYAKPALQAGIAAAALGLGIFVGRRIGLNAVGGAKGTLAAVKQLGGEAAKLNKTKGVLAHTPGGERMTGLVKEAKALGGPDLKFATLGAPPKAASVVSAAIAAEGAIATAIGLGADRVVGLNVASDETRSRLLAVGAGSLFMAGGLKTGLALARSSIPRPSPTSLAQIRAGEARLAREIAGKSGAVLAANARTAAATARQGTVRATTKAAVMGEQGRGAVRLARTGVTGQLIAATQAQSIAAMRGARKAAGVRQAATMDGVKGRAAVSKARAKARQPASMNNPNGPQPRRQYTTKDGRTVLATEAQAKAWGARRS